MSVSRVLVSAALAGAVALSTAVGPAFLPASLGGASARAEVAVSIDVFHQELSPYGQWATVPGYGEVWYPSGVGQGWRPYYNDGHWAYSDDYGWMWVSDLPWGWAPFHYGRWAFAAPYGWIWVPGRTWGPAWVTFREAPGYIGWAPLPPEAVWDPGYGFSRPYDVGDAQYWNFVHPEGFLAPRFDRYAYDRHDYPRIIHNTTNITNITVINNRIVNRSITVNQVEQATHKRVQRVQVTEAQRPQAAKLNNGNRLVVYKPAIDGQKAGAKSAPGNPNQARQLRNPEAINPAAGGANLQSQPFQSQRTRESQLRSLQPQNPAKANKQAPALQQQGLPQSTKRKDQQLKQLQQQQQQVQPQSSKQNQQQLKQLRQQQQFQPQSSKQGQQQLKQLRQQQQVQPQSNKQSQRQLKQLRQQQQQQLQPQKSTRKKQQLQQFQPQQQQQKSTRKERQAPQFQQQQPQQNQGQQVRTRKTQCGGPGLPPC
jgi:DNA segregation ATPase FtsK/SpoIIIE-like protein